MKKRVDKGKSGTSGKKPRGPSKRGPERAASTRRKARRVINVESELLGLLTSLIRERSNLTNKGIANALDPANSKASEAALKRLLERGAPLEDPKDKKLKQFLAKKLKELQAEDPDHILFSDLTYFYGSVLNAAGLRYSELTGINDERPFDRELIERLRIKAYEPASVLDAVRGFWFVIRYSTEGGDGGQCPFNVSLLTIKELNYRPKRHESPVKRMCSHTPHFSLRSARNPADVANGSKPHIHRGWVIPTVYPAATLNFIGGREDEGGPITTMSLRISEQRGHAALGRGVSISSNRLSLFACPVAACYVSESEALHKLRVSDLDDDARDLEVSEQYRALRDRLMEQVRRHDQAQLVERLGSHCDAKMVATALSWLEASKAGAAADGGGGAYFVPDE